MSDTKYPDNYLLKNSQQTKQIAIVVQIEGVPYYFTLVDLYTKVRYGDPGITYGLAGLVYGSLKIRSDVKNLLTLNGSLTISQRLEPEQGRASISTFTLVFTDKDAYLTQVCSPGVIVDELMGGKEVKIFLGYQSTSFPDDYFCVFRGTISTCLLGGAEVALTLSDANQKTRQPVFTPGNTVLSGGINNSVTTIPVVSTSSFYHAILSPDSSTDQGYIAFIQIDSEWMKVTAMTATSFTVVRNQAPIGESLGGAASHSINATVTGGFQLGTTATSPQGMHAITAALKIMLSGWGGPWISNVSALALGKTFDLTNPVTNCIHLPYDKSAIEDYGLAVGDQIIISGSGAGNNGNYLITDFGTDETARPNRMIYLGANLSPEDGGTMAFRSQFDTLPLEAGLKMKPTEIDVATFVLLKTQFFSGTENNMSFALLAQQTGKDFIEKECFLPLGAYSLTRYGRLSLGYTRPPVPGVKLITLDQNNILSPDKIKVTRSLTNRRFYNLITYSFDKIESTNVFQTIDQFLDTASDNKFVQVSELPVDASGVRSSLGGGLLATKRSRSFLTRFKDAAIEISLSVNWMAGSVIEAGDVIILDDEGNLKIANLFNGKRDLGIQLFEVIDRKVNVKDGTVQLTLLSGIIDTRTDRYGVVAPSSKTDTGSTTTAINIKPSYGSFFGAKEWKKWADYVGLNIRVHDYSFTHDGTVILDSISTTLPNTLILRSALGFTPGANYIVDLGQYPTNTDKTDQKLAKLVHAFFSPSVAVTSGTSHFIFNVGGGDISKFISGAVVQLHVKDYSVISPEAKITGISGNQITVDTDLTFTPSTAHTIEFIGFADSQGAYRFL